MAVKVFLRMEKKLIKRNKIVKNEVLLKREFFIIN